MNLASREFRRTDGTTIKIDQRRASEEEEEEREKGRDDFVGHCANVLRKDRVRTKIGRLLALLLLLSFAFGLGRDTLPRRANERGERNRRKVSLLQERADDSLGNSNNMSNRDHGSSFSLIPRKAMMMIGGAAGSSSSSKIERERTRARSAEEREKIDIARLGALNDNIRAARPKVDFIEHGRKAHESWRRSVRELENAQKWDGRPRSFPKRRDSSP